MTRARSAVEKVAGFWTQGARKLMDQTYMFPQLPQAGLIPAVERYFEFVKRSVASAGSGLGDAGAPQRSARSQTSGSG